MAFIVKNEDAAENNKQHLNLSTLAFEVIQNDMFAFGEDKLSGFINTVFACYYPVAEASVSRTLNCLRGDMNRLLIGVPGDENTKRRIVERLLGKKADCLMKKADSYGGGRSFKCWLNKKNLEYLTEADSECEEEVFYGRRGKYIKSVLEEYARLPYAERERIYFTPYMEAIGYAINKERQLRIVTGGDIVYSVYPYEIVCDPLSTANYLVGYCRRYGLGEEEKNPCSFRISALKSVKVEKSKSAFLKESEKRQLVRTAAARGVQFMMGNEAEIQVRLTEEGLLKYRRQAHLRPVLVEKRDNNIYVFQCTTAQAEFYFFKFGKDAEILSPLSLRGKFRAMYDMASELYKTKEEETK